MKRFSKYIVLLVVAVALVLTGCSSGLVMPKSSDQVYGNGGLVVQKGEYLYFTNAYTPYLSLEDEVSNGDKNKEFGIYRAKLESASRVSISYDENNFSKNIEKITSKLAGFESAGLYIVGDYLFFASPNMHQTKNNQNRFDYLTFFSIKLDGTKLKELYTTNSSENADWKIFQVNNKSFLVTVEGDKIVRHEIAKNKLKNKTILANDIESAILPQSLTSSFDQDIYYVKGFSKQEKEELFLSGDVFEKVNFVTGKKTVISQEPYLSINLLTYEHSRLFYSKSSSITQNEGIYVIGQTQSSTGMKISNVVANKADFKFMGENKPLIYKFNSKVFAQFLTLPNTNDQPNLDAELLLDHDARLVMIEGDYVYFSVQDKLSRISYKHKQVQTVVEGEFGKLVDFDGKYIYMFKAIEGAETSTEYLYRINTLSIEKKGVSAFESVGYVLEKDVSAVIQARKEEAEQNSDHE